MKAWKFHFKIAVVIVITWDGKEVDFQIKTT